MDDEKAICRICGFKPSERPGGEKGSEPTYGICKCCGAEPGHGDSSPEAIKSSREKWIREGMAWRSKTEPQPENWDPEWQLLNIPGEYSDFIRKNGIYLQPKLGVAEWAFGRGNALKYLDILRAKKIPCLGGDVIAEGKDGAFGYTHDNWHHEKGTGDSQEKYANDSIAKAIKYIKNYQEKTGGEYYYVMVAGLRPSEMLLSGR